ncbi:MAG TPA: hypothetical protein VGP26_31830 [Actinophytocola sp.]|jgi:hypothetical protein|nr:hypothetical protein [Actinophytocola sp.]
MKRRIGGAGGGSDPGPRKGAGAVAAAGAALAIFAGGAADVGIGAGIGGDALGGSAASDSVAESLTPRDLSARTSRASRSARKGKSDEAWRRMGLKRVKRSTVQYGKCVAGSTGGVQRFLAHTPCRSLRRMLVVVGNGSASVITSVVWISFRTRRQAADFKRVEDVPGSGDIKPLAATVLSLGDIRFTARHYHARRKGSMVTIAETEPLGGRPSARALDAIADVAAYLPRPG